MKKPSWRHLRGILLGALIALVAAVTALAILLAWQPAFYRQAVAADAGPDVAVRARRMVTKASALHAALTRPTAGQSGRWEAAIRDDEINAWLALDLPRSHRDWLPPGVAEPRLAFGPRHATVAARVGYGPFAAVASAEFEVVLRDVNQLAIAIERTSVGAIPLPGAAILRALASRIERLGIAADLRRQEGRMVLVVHLPAAAAAGAVGRRFEMLSLTDGELLLAGTSGAPPEVRPAPAVPAP